MDLRNGVNIIYLLTKFQRTFFMKGANDPDCVLEFAELETVRVKR